MVTVQVDDAFGNPIAGQTVTITGSASTLTGSRSVVTDTSGDAIFSSLSVSRSGTFTLTALRRRQAGDIESVHDNGIRLRRQRRTGLAQITPQSGATELASIGA